jgi:acetyl-CoA synthetase/4-hydroxybutyrate---CoA ligase (AMP-forming)
MNLVDLYRDVMAINGISDHSQRQSRAEAFFETIRKVTIPEKFNWAAEIFEGMHVRERGDQAALLWTDLETGAEARFTYAQLAAKGNQLLNCLRKHGVDHHGNIYMMASIMPETWFASFAAVKGGLVTVPTATNMTVRELEYRFKTYAPDVILADEAATAVLDEALAAAGKKPKIKLVLGEKAGWTPFEAIATEDEQSPAADTRSDDMLFCFFTSGTTGQPKRVAHTAVSYPLGHLSTALFIGFQPGDVHHNLSAPGWAKWAWSSFFAPLNIGATATGFAFKQLDGKAYIDAVTRLGVNTFCAPPTAWRMFVRLDLKGFDFSRLKSSMSAGEPLNAEIIEMWKRHTGTEIRDFYGQTESTAMIGNPPWMEGRMRYGSFGRPSGMYDVVLLDDEGQEIEHPEQTGHIAVRLDRWRAVGLFGEYMGDPDKMAAVFRGNYYYTGDRAYFDGDGYWWFVGRADDVIKSSDYRVGPFEVESALVEHPAVLETAVVGSPDPNRYQLVKAFVILNQGYQPSRELALDLFRHTMTILAKFKMPRIIEFVEALPKTISGKIRRIELREDEIIRKNKGATPKQTEFFYKDFPELSTKRE